MAQVLSVAVLTLLLAFAASAQAQPCPPAEFPPGRSFQRCAALPALGASLFWTYHAANGTADLAFRAAPQSAGGWVAWGINTERAGSMAGSSVFVASQDGGAVAVLMTYLESTSPSLANGTLRLDVPVAPAAEFAGGAYTIYVTVALPGNATLQNTVWQAGPPAGSGGQIAPHPMSGQNLQSTMTLDFLSGGTNTGARAPNSMAHRRNLRNFRGY